MNTKLKIYIGIIGLLLAVMVAIDLSKPKPINWKPTYGLKDKIPFGLFVFDKEFPNVVKGRKIVKFSQTPYEYLNPLYDYDTLVNTYKTSGTILAISQDSRLDDESVNELFYFAGHGNTIFLSMQDFPRKILDSLKCEYVNELNSSEQIDLWMANPELGDEKHSFKEGIGDYYFSKIDTTNTTVLGYQSGEERRVNFIKVPYNQGFFYLHLQPAAFTNFHLLKANHYQYAEKVLSYLPQETVYWSVKNQNGEIESYSQLRFIFSKPALRAAWYIFLAGMLVFIIFNAKRRQRVVSIKKPLPNTTVDFVKTIGNLYFQEGNHSDLIDKKIIYFLEKIRQDYLLDTTVLDETFVKKLHQKSGKEINDIERVVYLINQHRKYNFSSIEKDLIEINEAMEKIVN